MAKRSPERATHRPRGRFFCRTSAYRYAESAPRAGGRVALFIEMPRAKVFAEARVQPGRFAAVTVKSLSKVVGVQSLSTY